MHEVDVFGQRLANAAGESLRPAVGDETAPYLGLDLLLQLLDAAAVLVLQQPLLQPRQLAGAAPAQHVAARRLVAGAVHAGAVLAGRRPGLGDEPGEHAVEIEVPERAVEVVSAPYRTPGLHRRVAGDCEACDRSQHGQVAVAEGLVEHRCDLLGRHRLRPPRPGRRLAPALPRHPCRVVTGHEVVPADRVLRPPQREIDLEGGIEGAPVVGGLHQGGAKRELDRLSILERQVPDGLGRVGLLGHRDRQAGLAQLGHEAGEDVEHCGELGCDVPAVRRRTRQRALWPRPRCPTGT